MTPSIPRYLFLPQDLPSRRVRKGSWDPQNNHESKSTTLDFIHLPLHDLESIWWICFYCHLVFPTTGVPDPQLTTLLHEYFPASHDRLSSHETRILLVTVERDFQMRILDRISKDLALYPAFEHLQVLLQDLRLLYYRAEECLQTAARIPAETFNTLDMYCTFEEVLHDFLPGAPPVSFAHTPTKLVLEDQDPLVDEDLVDIESEDENVHNTTPTPS